MWSAFVFLMTLFGAAMFIHIVLEQLPYIRDHWAVRFTVAMIGSLWIASHA